MQCLHNVHMAPTMNRQDSYRRAERAYRLRCVGRTWQEIAEVVDLEVIDGASVRSSQLVPVVVFPFGVVADNRLGGKLFHDPIGRPD